MPRLFSKCLWALREREVNTHRVEARALVLVRSSQTSSSVFSIPRRKPGAYASSGPSLTQLAREELGRRAAPGGKKGLQVSNMFCGLWGWDSAPGSLPKKFPQTSPAQETRPRLQPRDSPRRCSGPGASPALPQMTMDLRPPGRCLHPRTPVLAEGA